MHNGLQQLQRLLSAPADALVISSPMLTARVYAELDPHGTPKIDSMSDAPSELATEAVGGISVWNDARRFFAALTLATAHVANITSDTTMLRIFANMAPSLVGQNIAGWITAQRLFEEQCAHQFWPTMRMARAAWAHASLTLGRCGLYQCDRLAPLAVVAFGSGPPCAAEAERVDAAGSAICT